MLDTKPEADEKSGKGMSDEELVTILDEMNRRAVGYLSDEVSVDQDDNLERYLGLPYGDEEEGSSTAMSMDVAEVVDWAMPDLLEPFVSGDKAIEFEPSTHADEAYCKQASDLVHHVFWNENPGFLILHDTVKTGAIQKLGVIKTVWKDETKSHEETMQGLSIVQLQELMQDQSQQIKDIKAEPATSEAYPDGNSYTVKVEKEIKAGCVKVMSIPPEQFKVSQRSAALDQDIEYVAHETEQTRGALIAMGFDYDLIMSLSSDKRRDTDRQDTRFQGEQRREDTGRKRITDLITLIEEYPLLDLEGENELCRWQIFRVGKTILDKQEVSEHPFDAWSPDRIPHRLIGLAIADKVKPTQKIKTHLTRQLLNNVYLANNPRTEVPEQAERQNGETIEDLLNVRIGGLIRTRQGGMLNPIAIPDRSKTALDAILYMDNVREQQSGITRNGAAMDSEAIDPKSATQVRKEDRNEQSRKRLMVRMIAETLLVPVFMKILKKLVKYQDQEKWIKLRNDWVPMDPRSWNAEMKARPSVGLGYANREEEMAAAMGVMNVQKEHLMAGTGLATPQGLYKAAAKFVEAVGWKFPEQYFLDPDSQEAQQKAAAEAANPKPDPKMAEVQGKQQIEQVKLHFAQQLEQVKTEAKMREAQQKAAMAEQVAMIKAATERQTAEMSIKSQAEIEAMRMMMEERLAIREQDIEKALAEREMKMKLKAAGSGGRTNISAGVQFGGDIG